MKRVAITGMGIYSPIGNSLEAVRDSLLSGRSGIGEMGQWKQVKGLRSLVGGRVTGINPKDIPRHFRRTMGRTALLGVFAAQDAVTHAGLEETTLASGNVGVAMGSTTGSVEALEQFFGGYLRNSGVEGMEGTLFMKVMSHTVAANVAGVLGTTGRLMAVCSACASSAQTIGQGYEVIQNGHQDAVICGGADELHPVTVGVFDILYAASTRFNNEPHRTPRPFDKDRDGLVLSEGAAAIVLEDYDRALARGAVIHAEILGYATFVNARHMTEPCPDSMARCMAEACAVAGVAPGDIDYVNAHATGTELGDATEAQALRAVIPPTVPVSGTKGHTGHTLAASGAMEVIFCVLMMQNGFLAPTLNLDQVDPACEGLRHVQTLMEARPRRILTSSFAFGGVNASLVLGAV